MAVDAHPINRKYRGQRGRFQIPKNTSCIVCNNKGYWWTNHSKEKRLDVLHRNKYVRKFVASITEDDEHVTSSTHNDDDDDGADDQYVDELKDLSGIAHVYGTTKKYENCL